MDVESDPDAIRIRQLFERLEPYLSPSLAPIIRSYMGNKEEDFGLQEMVIDVASERTPVPKNLVTELLNLAKELLYADPFVVDRLPRLEELAS